MGFHFQVIVISTVVLAKCSGISETKYVLKNKLALEVLRLKPNTNLVVSTLPLYFAACKLATVADDEAREEIMNVLSFRNKAHNAGPPFEATSIFLPVDAHDCYKKLRETLITMQQYSLISINKLYLDYTDDVKPEFVKNSTELYGVNVEKVGFKYPKTAVSYINRWIETNTYMRIRDMLGIDDMSKNTTMLLVNAMYHQVQWRTTFDYRETKSKRFFHPDITRLVYTPMMSRMDEYYYFDFNQWDCKILVLPQDTEHVYVTIVMPNTRDGLPRLLETIYQKTEELRTLLKTMQPWPIVINVPSFKIKSFVDWTGFLQEMGLYKIFNKTSSGLNSILKDESKINNIHLELAKQKVVFEMDEMGPFRHAREPDPELWRPQLVKKVETISIENPFYFMVTIGFDYDIFNGVYYGPE